MKNKAWFDEPVNRDPGSSVYPAEVPMAEAKKERKKDPKLDKEKQAKPEEIQMDVIKVLDPKDVAPYVTDPKLVRDIVKANIHISRALYKLGLWTEPAPGTGQYTTPPESSDPEATDPMSTLVMEDIKDIGTQIGIIWDDVEFTVEAFGQGLLIELEHGSKDPETDVTHNDMFTTAKIAWAHLKEDPKYYDKLKTIEKKDTKVASEIYMTLCPKCRSIQQVQYWEPTTCPNCTYPIPPYVTTHPEELNKPEEEKPAKPKKREPTVVQSQLEGKKISPNLRQEINAALAANGLNGNISFDKPSKALTVAGNVLVQAGLQLDNVPQQELTANDEGKATVDLKWTGDDTFSPEAVANSVLVLHWNKVGENTFECLAYVS
jgi:hypothetical protein